jgi:hypothetical protein
MGRIITDLESAPSAPAASKATTFWDSTTKHLASIDSSGFRRGIISNYSTTSQAPAATTRTYLTGSALSIPTGKLQIGTCFRWTMSVTKTNAGTALSTYDICVGTAGTTADTARVSFHQAGRHGSR